MRLGLGGRAWLIMYLTSEQSGEEGCKAYPRVMRSAAVGLRVSKTYCDNQIQDGFSTYIGFHGRTATSHIFDIAMIFAHPESASDNSRPLSIALV